MLSGFTDFPERAEAPPRGELNGERGIRTPGRVTPTHAFQACAFNRSAISPNYQLLHRSN